MHDLFRGRDVHGRGEGVVRRLRHVDIVVGVNRLLRADYAARHFYRTIGDDFVDVHVRLRAATRLPDSQRKVRIERARNHFVGRIRDAIARRLRHQAERRVRHRRRLFQRPKRTNDGSRHEVVADREVDQRACRLRAVIAVARHLDFAHRVGFHTHRHESEASSVSRRITMIVCRARQSCLRSAAKRDGVNFVDILSSSDEDGVNSVEYQTGGSSAFRNTTPGVKNQCRNWRTRPHRPTAVAALLKIRTTGFVYIN